MNWVQGEVRGSLSSHMMVLWRKYSKMYENSYGEKEKSRDWDTAGYQIRVRWFNKCCGSICEGLLLFSSWHARCHTWDSNVPTCFLWCVKGRRSCGADSRCLKGKPGWMYNAYCVLTAIISGSAIGVEDVSRQVLKKAQLWQAPDPCLKTTEYMSQAPQVSHVKMPRFWDTHGAVCVLCVAPFPQEQGVI